MSSRRFRKERPLAPLLPQGIPAVQGADTEVTTIRRWSPTAINHVSRWAGAEERSLGPSIAPSGAWGNPGRAIVRRYMCGASTGQTAVEGMRQHRNRDGGFWVAATDPLAAEQALAGTIPTSRGRAAALLSDGATRLVDRFGLATWRQTLDLLDRQGPSGLIHEVRMAERSDPNGSRWPRGKTFDDATALHYRF